MRGRSHRYLGRLDELRGYWESAVWFFVLFQCFQISVKLGDRLGAKHGASRFPGRKQVTDRAMQIIRRKAKAVNTEIAATVSDEISQFPNQILMSSTNPGVPPLAWIMGVNPPFRSWIDVPDAPAIIKLQSSDPISGSKKAFTTDNFDYMICQFQPFLPGHKASPGRESKKSRTAFKTSSSSLNQAHSLTRRMTEGGPQGVPKTRKGLTIVDSSESKTSSAIN